MNRRTMIKWSAASLAAAIATPAVANAAETTDGTCQFIMGKVQTDEGKRTVTCKRPYTQSAAENEGESYLLCDKHARKLGVI